MSNDLLFVDRLLPDVDGRLVLVWLLWRRFLRGGRWLVVEYWHALIGLPVKLLEISELACSSTGGETNI